MKKKVEEEAKQQPLLEAAPHVAFEYGGGDIRFIHEGIETNPHTVYAGVVCPEWSWINRSLPQIEERIAQKNK